jgi:hypothetical protein
MVVGLELLLFRLVLDVATAFLLVQLVQGVVIIPEPAREKRMAKSSVT